MTNDDNAANEGGVNIDLQPATATHSNVHPDRVVNLPTDTDMMDASDSMPETSKYWLDGTSDIDPAKSANKSRNAKTKGKRATVQVADGEEGDTKIPPAPKPASKATPKKGILKPSTPKTPASKISAKRKAQVIDNDGSDDDTPTRKGANASNLSGRLRKVCLMHRTRIRG